MSPAIVSSAVHPPPSKNCLRAKPIYSSSIFVPIKCIFSISRKIPKSSIRCELAVNSTASVDLTEEEEDEKAKAKIGTRVKVTVPLKVYHVVRVPEIELMGKEGLIKDYVVLWKGKRISANLPFKVEFVVEVEGRGPVKFFTHLKEDEFEFLDP